MRHKEDPQARGQIRAAATTLKRGIPATRLQPTPQLMEMLDPKPTE